MAVHSLQHKKIVAEKAVGSLMGSGGVSCAGGMENFIIQDDGSRIDIFLCHIPALLIHYISGTESEEIFPERSVFRKDSDQKLQAHFTYPFFRINGLIFPFLIFI